MFKTSLNKLPGGSSFGKVIFQIPMLCVDNNECYQYLFWRKMKCKYEKRALQLFFFLYFQGFNKNLREFEIETHCLSYQ